jgi:hypothetical protein
MPTASNRTIEQVTAEFIQEITGLFRAAAIEEVRRALGISDAPQARQLPQARSTYVKVKPKELDRVFLRVKTAKKPISTGAIAAQLMGGDDRRARYVLGKLLKKKLLTVKSLGDGTNRKVYLPTPKT